MRSYHALAWKELLAQKVISALILAAIVLSTMMTTAVGQSLGILQALREPQAGSLNGCRYATFHNLTKEQKALLEADGRLSFVGSNIVLGTAGLKNSGLSLQLREYDGRDLSAYPGISQLVGGRLPQRAGEIALPEDALAFLGFSGGVGDTVTLSLGISLLEDSEAAYAYRADFTLCGVLKSNYIGYGSGTVTGIAGPGTAEQCLPERYRVYSTDFRTAEKRGFQRTVDALAGEIGLPDSRIQYNWLYLNALGIAYDGWEGEDSGQDKGFSYMAAAAILVGALVLLAAGLVIYNVLKIAVGRRIREYGTLRAIGARRGQLYRLVAEQLFLLCLAGIPLGAGLGVLSAEGITRAATGLLSPEIFLAQSTEELGSLIARNSAGKPLPLLLGAAVALAFAFVAAMPAAGYAARISPVEAMNGTAGRVRRRNRKEKPVRRFEAFYAGLNLKRNPGRTAITSLSLAMSITVFVALESFSGLLDASKDVQKLHLGDYSVTNDSAGFAPSVLEELKSQKGVSVVFTLKYSLYQQAVDGALPIETDFGLKPGETLQIVGVDEERLKALAPSLTEAEMQELKDGKACLIKNPIAIAYGEKRMETTAFSAGDTVSVNHAELRVLGNCQAVGLDNQGFVNGVQVVVFDPVYDRLTGKSAYSELYPVLKDGADRKAVEQEIERICGRTAGSRWLSYQNTDRQLEESFRQVRSLAWGLILLIGLIGLLNIVNTTYTNIQTRVREIGIQRAVGMSRGGLYRTFLWEGACYGIIASVLGAAAGYVCTVFVEAAATDQIRLAAFPAVPTLQAAAASVAACLIATCQPLHRIAKLSIVDSVETLE